MSKICNMDWKWPSPSPPPLELFRKFIRFGVATRPYILHASQNIEFSELKMILSRCLHKTASTLPIDLMLEVRVLIAIILNLKGHFQSEYNKCQNAFWGTWVIFFCPHPPSMFRPRRPKCFSWSGFHFSHSERRKAEAERDVEALLIVGKLVSGGGITSKDASSRQIPPKVLFFKSRFCISIWLWSPYVLNSIINGNI